MSDEYLYKGAEAELFLDRYLGRRVLCKRRIKKTYRIDEIDDMLRSQRTREEAKLITDSRRAGVDVPFIYDVDLVRSTITMEYVEGERVKDIMSSLTDAQRKDLCLEIGRNIARLHNHQIIHGDITTSNMIKSTDGRLLFIDFGLGCKRDESEVRGVDLHVLMEALESTHSEYPKSFGYVLMGYSEAYDGDSQEVLTKIDDIVKRGRYR